MQAISVTLSIGLPHGGSVSLSAVELCADYLLVYPSGRTKLISMAAARRFAALAAAHASSILS